MILSGATRVDLGVMSIKGYFTFPKAPGRKPHNQVHFSIIYRSFVGVGVLPLYSDAVGIFYLFQSTGLRMTLPIYIYIYINASLSLSLSLIYSHFNHFFKTWRITSSEMNKNEIAKQKNDEVVEVEERWRCWWREWKKGKVWRQKSENISKQQTAVSLWCSANIWRSGRWRTV